MCPIQKHAVPSKMTEIHTETFNFREKCKKKIGCHVISTEFEFASEGYLKCKFGSLWTESILKYLNAMKILCSVYSVVQSNLVIIKIWDAETLNGDLFEANSSKFNSFKWTACF